MPGLTFDSRPTPLVEPGGRRNCSIYVPIYHVAYLLSTQKRSLVFSNFPPSSPKPPQIPLCYTFLKTCFAFVQPISISVGADSSCSADIYGPTSYYYLFLSFLILSTSCTQHAILTPTTKETLTCKEASHPSDDTSCLHASHSSACSSFSSHPSSTFHAPWPLRPP
jgi:hypothetical protein